MEKRKVFLALMMSLCLTACAGKAANGPAVLSGPERVMESTMESLKALDLETFNSHTDNYVATHRNWLGIPVGREYRVFSELMQPGIKVGKHDKWELAEKIVENLSWEIEEVRETGNEAQIDMTLTNKDLTDVAGIYEINVLRGMINSNGTGLIYLAGEVADLVNNGGKLSAIVDEMDQISSIAVTVQAKKQDGEWRIHLSEEFIEAFMGNLGGSLNDGKYSEEIEKQIYELELKLEYKADKMADKIGEDVERWMEGLFE